MGCLKFPSSKTLLDSICCGMLIGLFVLIFTHSWPSLCAYLYFSDVQPLPYIFPFNWQPVKNIIDVIGWRLPS